MRFLRNSFPVGVRFAVSTLSLCALSAWLAGCARQPSPPDAALKEISGENLMNHIRTLASDQFEGRAPGSRGEELTVQYLEKQFREFGLKPGNPDGTYLQKVPLVEITPDVEKVKLTLSARGKTISPKFKQDYVQWTKRVVESVSADGELVFAGYGAQAPEYQWDDFKGTDLKGKFIVVLINDPPLQDEKMFGGKAMTYYGRWTYKYEKAAELGAAGCFIIHETGPAGYPWEVVSEGRSKGQFDLSTPDKNMGRAPIEGWFTWDQADRIFKAAGKNLAELKKSALSRDFKPVPLGVTAKAEIRNSLRNVDSRNVVARLEGSDPKLKSEYVIYTAHWDHFGIGTPVNGDKIYNGAIDNASGTAGLLEMAHAYTHLETPPARSILFLAVTAEEQGLLGSRYYAEHPLYPLADTVAEINTDGLNMLGKTRDIVSIGHGSSTLDKVIEDAARAQGRVVKQDPEPEKGFFYRSDHFYFAKAGVPAFSPNEGIDYVGKPEGWGMQQRDRYTAQDYHKPSDDVKADWVTDGAVQDLQLFLAVGINVANSPQPPEWKPNAEFRAARIESLRKAGKLPAKVN